MSRRPRLTRRYLRTVLRLGVRAGSPEAVAMARCIRSVLASPSLPGPLDVVALMPPTGAALVRRVTAANLWVWFRVEDDAVAFVHLSRQPPTPLLDET